MLKIQLCHHRSKLHLKYKNTKLIFHSVIVVTVYIYIYIYVCLIIILLMFKFTITIEEIKCLLWQKCTRLQHL